MQTPFKVSRLVALLGSLLTACAVAEGEESQMEAAPGSAQQPLYGPVGSIAPFERVDLEGPISFSYYTPAELRAMGLPERRCDGVMTDVGRAYSVSLEGSVCNTSYFNLPVSDPEYDRPYINPNFHYNYIPGYTSGSSLQLTLPPRKRKTTPDGVTCFNSTSNCKLPGPDRAELSVYADGFEARDGVGFGFEDPKYFSFRMYIPAPSGFSLMHGDSLDPGDEGVFFMQAWQYHSSEGDGCGVPLVAKLENSTGSNLQVSPVQFRLESRAQNGAPSLGAQAWPLPVNTWHQFTFFLRPNSDEMPGHGQVTAWLDGAQILDWHNDWGCNTAAPGSMHTDQWHLRVGMYRTASGIIDQRLDLFFDDIRVAPAKSLAEVF